MVILQFSQVGAGDIHLVGGKGANLGEMAQAGFPVPPGFCVTAAAYRQFIAEAGLWPAIAGELASVPAEDMAALEAAAARIRGLLEAAPVPAEVEAAVVAAYARLSGGRAPVAVRSSATAEDLPEASFAGQQETYLNVQGEAAVLAAVRRCWASLWTARAIAYRRRNGFPHEQVHLAVVVQEMVEPDTAGVLFTANPLSNNPDEILVNAAYGLGESVVSGRVTPDTYRLAKQPELKVVEKTLGAKGTRMCGQGGGGTVTEAVPRPDQERFCLDSGALQALVSLGLRVEAHYQAPQDIEWALAGGRLYLLQARPITTLARAVPKRSQPGRRLTRTERLVLDDILEHYPDPPYPLDYEAVTSGYETLLGFMRGVGLAVPPAGEIICMDELGIPSIRPAAPRPTWRLLALPWRLRTSLRYDPADWGRAEAARFTAVLADLRTVSPAHLTGAALADHIDRAMAVATELGQVRFTRYIGPMMIRGALVKFFIRLGGGPRKISEADLLGGLSYKTMEIDQALQRLATVAAAAPEVQAALLDLPAGQVRAALAATPAGPAFLQEVTLFLNQHGARTMKVYLPFSTSSWSENADSLWATLAALLRLVDPDAGETRAAAAAERYRQLRERVAARLPGPLRRAYLAGVDRFRMAHVVREATLYAIEEALALARAGGREAGRQLAAAGALAAPEQVIFLTLPELRQALQGQMPPETVRRTVARRRAARTAAEEAWRGPEYGAAAVGEGDLSGQPGSPGVARGAVKVIVGPAEFGKLQQGDVLVCNFTDPAWTPLFALAAAVVADTGGPLSHAAIVAREYGIPAVLGTRVATARLKDGDTVVVDGARGLVRVQTPPTLPVAGA